MDGKVSKELEEKGKVRLSYTAKRKLKWRRRKLEMENNVVRLKRKGRKIKKGCDRLTKCTGAQHNEHSEFDWDKERLFLRAS